ncbi:MAG: carbon-nitrogen hydrolase family protein [Cenarchaeum sp. SB0665_bin_23]|nr:carbon-nitrogen hydrolase family protein [Cenarchaeum sp. SB0664_bin_35]MXY61157.1 carbon-nitrogen hydrolase family protein [Cenarchaeum sp. SB0665_bin_23]MYB46787.1 carbon-nitrogen hydrolase family protein [Cenarchaeum sp. SB0662_bin_33]MYG33460.1 carbon-nitrogen hydrolase family protein [Cenarchaeum sp. SB0677_bin_16]
MTKVAIVQMKASIHKAENQDRILEYIQQTADGGANMCTFPEFMMFHPPYNRTSAEIAADSEDITGPFITSIRQAAKENQIEVVGTFYETSSVPERVYDTAFIVNSIGEITSVYRKTHLYDALGFTESDKLVQGDTIASPIQTSAGMVGMLICYDLRFPEVSRALADAGSQILVVPSAWVRGYRKKDHWITMNRARAIENGCYIIAPAHAQNLYCGHSVAIDPFGDIMLELGDDEDVAYVNIDTSIVDSTREKLPLLKNRRLDIYPDLKGVPK